jgi:hypothetical protein
MKELKTDTNKILLIAIGNCVAEMMAWDGSLLI